MENILDSIDKWIRTSVKRSDMGSEGTTHPSKDVDGGTQPATTGERASENESDVKSQVIAQSTDEAKEKDAEGIGGVNTPSNTIGTVAAPTGEGPTLSVKDTKDDPGSSHDARTDNSAVGADKYAALQRAADDILAAIAVATKAAEETCPADEKKEEAKPMEAPKAEDKPAEEKKDDAEAAKQAGYAVADAVIKQAGLDKAQLEMLDVVYKRAAADVANVIDVLSGYVKQAEMGMDPAAMGVDPAAMGGAPVDPAALDAAVQAAGGAAPAEAPAAGGAVSEQELDELVDALVEAGVTPEDIVQAVESGEGAAPAEAPAAEAPAAEAPAAPVEAETESTSETEEDKQASVAWKRLSKQAKARVLRNAVKLAAASK